MACKYCDRGVRLVRGDHWIVRSIIPAVVSAVRCKDWKGNCSVCGEGPCRYGGDASKCVSPKIEDAA